VVDHRDIDSGLAGCFGLVGEVLVWPAGAQHIGGHQQHHPTTIS
jgi:hypothetical protein